MEMADVAGEVLPGLWVSGMPTEHWDLVRWGVDVVVTLSDHLPPQAARRMEWATPGGAVGEGRMLFVHWPIEDGELPDGVLGGVVVSTVSQAVRDGLTVLVHCYEGRNRSGLVVALAACELTQCSGADALRLVRSARPGMLANREFARALQDLGPGKRATALQ